MDVNIVMELPFGFNFGFYSSSYMVIVAGANGLNDGHVLELPSGFQTTSISVFCVLCCSTLRKVCSVLRFYATIYYILSGLIQTCVECGVRMRVRRGVARCEYSMCILCAAIDNGSVK